jgi:uncharacterized membrane protein
VGKVDRLGEVVDAPRCNNARAADSSADRIDWRADRQTISGPLSSTRGMAMKKTVVSAVIVAALSFVVCQPAFAGSSTDAALGLGAFAVFNQLFGGFAAAPVIVAQPPVVYAPPPPVVYAPPPVVYAPPPVAYYPPPPPPVIVYPGGYAYAGPRYYYRPY